MDENEKNAVDTLAAAIAKNMTATSSSNENGNDAGTSDQNASGASGATTDKPQERMFTQEEVSKMMAREKHQGKNSVYNELGIDPDDTSAIQMFKAFVESQKSKEEKQVEAAQKQKAEMLEMQHKLKVSETKAALMQAGVLGDYVDDAVVIAMAKLDTDDSLDIDTVAKDLKSKYSVWFGGSGEDTNNNKKTPGQKGTGMTVGNSGNSTGGQQNNGNNGPGVGIGARLAAQRKAGRVEQSFWKD